VYANAVRAPNIAELYDGQSQTFPESITDPCEGVGATTAPPETSAAAAAYCRALPGFTQNLASNGGIFTLDDNIDRQSIEGFDGGNPALNEEKAKTWTLGLVYTPTALPSLTATIDWYHIKINDAIQLVPRQYIVDQCAASGGASDLCDFITRENAAPVRPRSPGVLWQINSGPVNAASIETAGVDLGLRYHYNLEGGGKFSTSLVYSYLDKLTLQPIADEPVENNRGQLNGDGRLGAGFKHRANVSFGYDVGGWSASWRLNYQSSILDTLGEDPNDPDSEYLKVKAYTYHDMQVRYDFERMQDYSVYLGVDNVFNKKPPVVDQNKASTITGTETAAESYDPIGRFIYVGLGVKF
jgi:outer membrane receptor protein involved in Fe transport